MQIEAIPMLINSDFMNVPLDKLLHLTDYKMYGEDSYVFQQKELLYELYECTYLSMNDKELSAEALDYLLKNNKNIGEALSNVYSIERKDLLKSLRTMQAVASSSTAMQAVVSSSTAMQAVVSSSTAMQAVVSSSTAMQAVVSSSTAMQAVASSSTAMQAVVSSSTAMQAVASSSTAMQAVVSSSTAMQAVFSNEEMMTCILNSTNCMLLKNTGLPGANGYQCYGKFILIASTYEHDCVDSCIPDYRSLILNKHSKIINTSKFGKIFVKLGVPGVPLNTVYSMLDDANGGNLCVVYKL